MDFSGIQSQIVRLIWPLDHNHGPNVWKIKSLKQTIRIISYLDTILII